MTGVLFLTERHGFLSSAPCPDTWVLSMGVSRPESEADYLPASAAKNIIQGVPTHRRIKVKALGTVIIVGPLRINSCIVYSVQLAPQCL